MHYILHFLLHSAFCAKTSLLKFNAFFKTVSRVDPVSSVSCAGETSTLKANIFWSDTLEVSIRSAFVRLHFEFCVKVCTIPVFKRVLHSSNEIIKKFFESNLVGLNRAWLWLTATSANFVKYTKFGRHGL